MIHFSCFLLLHEMRYGIDAFGYIRLRYLHCRFSQFVVVSSYEDPPIELSNEYFLILLATTSVSHY